VSQADEQIYRLLQDVRRHESGSIAQRKALNRLLMLLQRQPGLLRSSHQDYAQALNRTWEWFTQNIYRFDPSLAPVVGITHQLIIWINGYLKWRITDLYKSDAHSPISLDRPFVNPEGEQVTLKDKLPDPAFRSLDLLEQQIEQLQQQQQQRLEQQIRQLIKQDQAQQLQQCHPRQRPDCNCQVLALRLLLQQPPDRIAQLATELEIKDQTLYSHWNKKCLPLLRAIARHYGYPS
jgi:hypothetical protein